MAENRPLRLETERLLLYPVSDEEMERLIERETDADVRQAYREMLHGCKDDPVRRVWYAAWYMELKEAPGTVAGDLCFKGTPAGGAIEVGYGLKDGFCGRGYMTEAVKAICGWALSQPGVTRVEAETAPENADSQGVLQRAGFVETGAMGEEGPRFALEMRIIPYESTYRDDMIFMVLEAKDALGRIPRLNEDLLHIESAYPEKGDAFFLALDARGRVAGCGGYSRIPDTDEAFVHRLYVKADRKRSGIGTALLAAIEADMRTKGITVSRVHLGTPEAQWHESYAFYPKHGYAPYAPAYMEKHL